jgi:hypothetical protein
MTLLSPTGQPETLADSGSRGGCRSVAFVLSVYLLLSIFLFWPSPPWDGSRLPTDFFGQFPGDPQQMTWFLRWLPFALEHGLNIFHTRYIDYPTGVNLASNTSVPLLGLFASPITATLGPVVAFNLLMRLAFFSSASSMYFLLRTWCRRPASFVGGLLYGFGPYMVTEGQAHLNLAFAPLPPLIVWCLYQLLVERRRPPKRLGLLLGALIGAQGLIEPEILVMLGIVVSAGLVGLAAANRHRLAAPLARARRALFYATGVATALMGWWMWSLIFGANRVSGTVLKSVNLQDYRADLLSPFLPTDQLIAPIKLQFLSFRFVGGNYSENVAYLSLPTVVFIVVASIVWRKSRVIVTSALLALVAFILSLGPSLRVDNRATNIPMPGALFTHLPLMDNFIPARFGFVMVLFAVIAFTLGVDRFVDFLRNPKGATTRTRALEIGGVLAVVLSVMLVIPRVPFQTAHPPWPSDTVATLNVIPPGSNVLTYPFTLLQFTEAMAWQATDNMRFRLIGGYATVQGHARSGQQYPELLSPPFVQEYLEQVQGTTSLIPIYPKPSAHTDPVRAFCFFLTKFHVGAVVFWRAGEHPQIARALFLHALGPPAAATRDRTVLVWLTHTRRCA